jgi:hypothetical protein
MFRVNTLCPEKLLHIAETENMQQEDSLYEKELFWTCDEKIFSKSAKFRRSKELGMDL